MDLVVGIDVGGTFTDLILLDLATGAVRIAKVPTTVENQAFGVLAALETAEAPLAQLANISHGTTTTTNSLLERKVAKVGLITTEGFRDVLELGRRTRPKPYGLKGTFAPLIPRDLRLEVPERMAADGEVLTPLDEDAVRRAAGVLLDKGCEALVIHFLHSYRNPAHEKRAAEIATEVWPNAYITAGHAILSEYREYERGTTASVNAAVQPVLDRYIGRLQDELNAKGFDRDLLVMQGNGGSVAARTVARAAVNTVMSGPASGVMAAAAVARGVGLDRVITYDMGGTSSDVGLVMDGVPQVSAEIELTYAMPVHVPMVDVATLGAGGGSIAQLDNAGLLRVGPESAGASPGPIAYGRGGSEPTITDANLALGRLDPEGLLSVENPVTVEDVRAVILERVGEPLGLDGDGAAAAILQIANHHMAGAIRMMSLSRGHDPRDFTLFAFGGAGPMHAVALARELAIPRVLIPVRPGITNALGCITADLRHDFVNTLNAPLAALDIAEVAEILNAHRKDGAAMIEHDGVAVTAVEFLHVADMQFEGQTHLLAIPVSGPDVTVEELRDAFAKAYWDRFAVELPEIRPVLVNLRTGAIGRRPNIDLKALAGDEQAGSMEAAQTGTRRVWFPGGWADTPIYRRRLLPQDAHFAGPAIVEQLDCTTVIDPGAEVVVDEMGNLAIEVGT
jgi:N-methylhydantoinase A